MQVIILNVVLVAVVFFIFLRKRKGLQPSKLNLSGSTKKTVTTPDHRSAPEVELAGMEPPGKPKEKVLNVLVEYEGKTRDAYEILGVPAGSPVEKVRTAYRTACIGKPDNETIILKLAFEAIHKTKS